MKNIFQYNIRYYAKVKQGILCEILASLVRNSITKGNMSD